MNFGAFNYTPILGVKPAEMQALQELPMQARNNILPYIVLQPWTTAKEFINTTEKVSACTMGKKIIVDLTDDTFDGNRRPVHDVFDALRNPANGYAAWCDFVEGNEPYVPVVQLRQPHAILPQIDRFKAMGRGVVIRLHEQIFEIAPDIARQFRRYQDNSDVYFILDFQRQDRDILFKGLNAVRTIRAIRAEIPDCYISVSATTFPSLFVDLSEQEIYERQFYEIVSGEIGYERHLYCDRGSTRAESQNGGNGPPAPRIDYALQTKWKFFREADEDDRDVAYQIAASSAVASEDWVDKGIWGTEMIKRTVAGDENGIYSSKTSTAARINIHVYTQSGAEDQPEEIEWSDI